MPLWAPMPMPLLRRGVARSVSRAARQGRTHKSQLHTASSAEVAWVYSREYAVLDGWDSGHRFAMEKYPRLFDRLVQRGVLSPSEGCEPADPAGNEWLHRAHSAEYVAGYCDGTLAPNAMRRIGLPWSPAMVRAVRLEVAGTLLAARLALSTGIACNLGGGTHHAQRAAGSGFNPFNDLAVASLALLAEGAARRVLVVDLDVHQGDGTAAILSEEPRAATFSMHAARAFPVRKQRSTVDVGLPNGTGDEEYLRLLREHLPPLLDEHRPDLVLYDAGSACAESASGRARGRDHPSPLLVHRRRLPRRGRGADLLPRASLADGRRAAQARLLCHGRVPLSRRASGDGHRRWLLHGHGRAGQSPRYPRRGCRRPR